MSKPNIVLLGTDSRDSNHRARNWTKAARARGLAVRSYPDHATRAVIPCTDLKVVDAAMLARMHGVPGPDPVAATVLASKALAFEFLRSRGFEVLFSRVPMCPQDLEARFSRPVILKPERGSGGIRVHPWGYRTFDGTEDFRRYLARAGMQRWFFDYQRDPDPVQGRYLMQEFVEAKWLNVVRMAVGPARASVFEHSAFTVTPGTRKVESRISGEPLPGVERIVAMASAFGRFGFHPAILLIQCVRARGVLQPIDFNFRTSAAFDLQNAALGLSYYEKALAFLLGDAERVTYSSPRPHIGVHHMYLRPRKGRYEIEFGADCIPLITEVTYDPKEPSDYGHAWPAFGVICKDRRDFMRRVKEVLASAKLRRVGTAAAH
jgi:hypothetical protein